MSHTRNQEIVNPVSTSEFRKNPGKYFLHIWESDGVCEISNFGTVMAEVVRFPRSSSANAKKLTVQEIKADIAEILLAIVGKEALYRIDSKDRTVYLQKSIKYCNPYEEEWALYEGQQHDGVTVVINCPPAQVDGIDRIIDLFGELREELNRTKDQLRGITETVAETAEKAEWCEGLVRRHVNPNPSPRPPQAEDDLERVEVD